MPSPAAAGLRVMVGPLLLLLMFSEIHDVDAAEVSMLDSITSKVPQNTLEHPTIISRALGRYPFPCPALRVAPLLRPDAAQGG